ncbi:hypothetical protein E3Q23_02761 [Wallemia mellicola]|uniref:Cytoplasmic tRNA 2-thiolation protein 2 n=1 Tax=Wallemia mellicola TaxID=1708541 RepID=A0A4T0QUJ9_9BASI|nr:hypothetical protein E3Q23_02761 [Wallemia mellicola]TIB88183.1 hypothetical protein E3Q19_03391 [Wallemia mellicola]TIC28191.1 hypothetical protein E3Q10_03303 [Wallemia mellicola]TIC64073.1 hypothetical protein E3Q01_02967 [Wallemia mellicola]
MSCGNPQSDVKDPGAETPERRTKPKNKICLKCKTEAPVIQVRHALYCRNCFIFTTSGKFLKWFLATFKTTDIYPAFYIGVSGGPSSRYLLHVLQTQLTPRKGKGNFIRPGAAEKLVVIYVNHANVVPGAQNLRKDIENMIKGYPNAEIIEVDVDSAWKDSQSSISAQLSGLPGQPPSGTTSSSTADLFDSTLATSSLESHLSLLTHHLILREARKHADGLVGKDKELPLFLATSATRVTIKLLSSMSRGRGWSLGSGEVQPESSQFGMRIYQPLLNTSSKEIAYFNKYVVPDDSKPVVNRTFSTFAPPKSSIDRLTEELVVSLERGFPSTVSTVAKTGNKISFAGEAKEGERLCTLCGWPARAKANDWKNGIAITKLDDKVESTESDQPSLADILCYGCYTNLTDSRARSEVNYALPGWTNEYAESQKLTEESMHKDTIKELLRGLKDIKIINNDPLIKKAAISGLSSKNELAVIIFEKSAFNESNFNQFDHLIDNHVMIQQNDIYHVLTSSSTPTPNDQKVTVIYPATQKHLDKHSKSEVSLFRETPEVFNTIVKPYIDGLPLKETKWISSLVSGEAENETYYYKGNSFVIAADYKWDKQDLNTLYLQVVVKDLSLKCLRDLRSSHILLLKSMREEVGNVLKTNWDLDLSQVKLAVHYQPTYYVFHVHVVSVNYTSFPGLNVGQAHLLDDIIEMMSITYECILLGTFDVGLLDKVKNKLRVNCDKNYDLKSHEIVFSVSAGPNTTNGRMVMRRDALDERAKWNAIRMFRAEPALLIRSTIDFELEDIDTSIPFIQSLGYAYNHEFTKRGEAYIYNDAIVSVYQLYNSNDEIVHAQNVWMAEVRSLPVIPDQSASIDPLNIAISNCLKLKQTLKPLIQLKRVEH